MAVADVKYMIYSKTDRVANTILNPEFLFQSLFLRFRWDALAFQLLR